METEKIEVVCLGKCVRCNPKKFNICYATEKKIFKKIKKGDIIKIEIIRK